MRIVPINNNQMSFSGYFSPAEKEIYRHFGKTKGEYINQGMTNLAPIAYIDGAGLDVVVTAIDNNDIFKRGVNIAVADEKSDIWFDYIYLGKSKNPQHVRAGILFDDITKLDEIPKIICNSAKGLIEAYNNCRKNPRLFEYYSKIFR